MSALVDRLVAHVLGIEVRLLACQARLQARTDPEALHDLRTTVRRLRSLLRPLRGLPGVEQLEEAASRVGQLTTPLRDREVLAAYLLEHNQPEAAQRRMAQMAEAYPALAASAEVINTPSDGGVSRMQNSKRSFGFKPWRMFLRRVR